MIKKKFDAIIIGGGIIGVSTMFHLSERGYKSLLLEKNTLASGSTGRCMGGIRAQFTSRTKIKVMKENIKFFSSFKEKFGIPIEWYSGGYLVLAHEDKHLENLNKSREYCNDNGVEVANLTPKECQEIIPGLNILGLQGANYCKTDGQANPFKVIAALTKLSKQNDAVVKTHTEVKAIQIMKDATKRVLARDINCKTHTFETDVIVNASGPDAQQVAEMVGINNIPIWNERHEILVTEPVNHFFNPLIIDQRVIKPFSANSYFIQNKETNQILGCFTPIKSGKFPDFQSNYPNFLTNNKTSSKEFIIEASQRIIDLLPRLKNLRIRRSWAGVYPMTYTGCPILDETNIKGYYLSIGFCGHGFMLGPTCGKLMAEMIDNKKPFIDISDWSLNNAKYLRDTNQSLEELN